MKTIVILCGQNCVYCKKAKMLMERAIQKNPQFQKIDIRILMEESEEGRAFKHELVPAFYCGETLVFEGNPDIDIVTTILRRCFESYYN